MESWWWCRWIMAVVFAGAILRPAASDPEINLLNKGCSQYNASNILDFYNNRNATFADLRRQISGENKLFATAQQSRSSDPVYALVQCRNYLSPADCLACYDAAVLQIKNCSAANGARVIYDGCYLRYFSFFFFFLKWYHHKVFLIDHMLFKKMRFAVWKYMYLTKKFKIPSMWWSIPFDVFMVVNCFPCSFCFVASIIVVLCQLADMFSVYGDDTLGIHFTRFSGWICRILPENCFWQEMS